MTAPPTPPMQSAREEAARLWSARHFESDIDGGIAEDAFVAGAEWERAQVEELIKALREEALTQWEYNHFEHCGHVLEDGVFTHDAYCHWPLPAALSGASEST